MVADAYATFDHPEVCPVVDLGDLHLLELFWGPTLAFKDVALQLVGRLFDHELTARGQRATIVVATSGDTGSAAIEACVGRDTPRHRRAPPRRSGERRAAPPDDHGRRAQRAQRRRRGHLRRLPGPREGAVRRRRRSATAVRLSAMNSINWARVMAQVVYYVTTVARLGRCSFAVPIRQLRQHLLRLDRRADGPADRPARDRLEQQRHPHPLGRRRLAGRRSRWCPPTARRWTSRCRRTTSGCSSSSAAATAPAPPSCSTRFRGLGAVEAPHERPLPGRHPRRREPPSRSSARCTTPPGVLVDPHTAVGHRRRPRPPHRRRRRWSRWPPPTRPSSPTPWSRRPASGPPLPARLADLFDREERFDVLPTEVEAVRAHVLAVDLGLNRRSALRAPRGAAARSRGGGTAPGPSSRCAPAPLARRGAA